MNDEILYYDNPDMLLHSDFLEQLINRITDLRICYALRFLVVLAMVILFPLIFFWIIIDLIGNVLDYLSYHWSVTFILWGMSQESKMKAKMKAKLS